MTTRRLLGGRVHLDPAQRLALVFAAWVATRVVVVVGGRSSRYPFQDDPFEISVLASWGAALAGEPGLPVPLRDGPWEYPLGAAPVVLAPALLGAPYVLGFVGQMVLWDAALLLGLALVGLRRGSLAGAWLWVAAVPLLGPVSLARFDVVPTALAVAGLAAPGVVAGALLVAGGAVKLWPALLLPLVLVVRPDRSRVLVGAATAATGTLALAAVHGVLPRVLSFLTYQRDRGLEVESLPALPLMLARATGDTRNTVGFGYGSYQVDGPWAGALLTGADVGLAGVLVVTAALLLRARGSARALLPAAVLLVAGVLVFDKVLSAQYPLWLAGLLALALCEARSPLRAAAGPLIGVLVLTQLVYPLAVQDLLAGQLRPVLLLAARDVLLLAVVAVAARALWRAGGTGSSGDPERDDRAESDGRSEDEVPLHVEDRQQAESAG